MKIICYLKGIWRSLPNILNGDYPIDGCDFVETEIHENCRVSIAKCEHCGKINISWEHTGRCDCRDEA
jgi:hypothetical protein